MNGNIANQLFCQTTRDEKRWKETLKDICEVARLCLHNLVGSNTPPLPRCYEQEFEQAALHLGKEEILDMVRVDSERQAYTIRTVILKASERIGQARVFLKSFDRDARKELSKMEKQIDILSGRLKLLKGEEFREVVDSAMSFKSCSDEFVRELSVVIDNITKQQKMLQELVQKVHEDPLTGVLNRRAWERDLRDISEKDRSEGRPYCIVMADLDNFKEINDLYGHPVGDAVLRQFAGLLKKHFGSEGSKVYRYGGDEFTVIADGRTTGDVKDELERLKDRLSNVLFVADNGQVKIRLTASFGVSQGGLGVKVDQVVEKADQMLYEAKKAGRNCIKCWDR